MMEDLPPAFERLVARILGTLEENLSKYGKSIAKDGQMVIYLRTNEKV
jgi:hypothetical protein